MRFILIVFMVFLLVPAYTGAQETDTTTVSPRETRMEKVQIVQENREEKREAIRAESERKKEAFQQKLSEIRDQKKQQLLERVTEKLGNVNQNRVDHYNKVLERLSGVLDKIKAGAAEASAQGKDTTALDAAIQAAEAAIDEAKAAVALQEDKDYTPEISSESALRKSVGAAMSGLQADLKTVKELVTAAKRSVRAAAGELRVLVSKPEPTLAVEPTVTPALQ